MDDNKEILALLHLIDDPDEEVYGTVSQRLLSFGRPIIPHLEAAWETIENQDAQERIEGLIHRLQFEDLSDLFISWKKDKGNLLEGAILVAKFNYPDLDEAEIRKQIEKIRRNTWLELNNYLTPMEQINVINSILFNYYKHRGAELDFSHPEGFLLNKILETRKGNPVGNGLLYLILCELLDVPLSALSIPHQFILGYFDSSYEALNPRGHASEKIKFYVDGLTGQMYSHKDMENYFKRLQIPPVNPHFKPMNNAQTLQFVIEQYAKCFDSEKEADKIAELQHLSGLLN